MSSPGGLSAHANPSGSAADSTREATSTVATGSTADVPGTAVNVPTGTGPAPSQSGDASNTPTLSPAAPATAVEPQRQAPPPTPNATSVCGNERTGGVMNAHRREPALPAGATQPRLAASASAGSSLAVSAPAVSTTPPRDARADATQGATATTAAVADAVGAAGAVPQPATTAMSAHINTTRDTAPQPDAVTRRCSSPTMPTPTKPQRSVCSAAAVPMQPLNTMVQGRLPSPTRIPRSPGGTPLVASSTFDRADSFPPPSGIGMVSKKGLHEREPKPDGARAALEHEESLHTRTTSAGSMGYTVASSMPGSLAGSSSSAFTPPSVARGDDVYAGAARPRPVPRGRRRHVHDGITLSPAAVRSLQHGGGMSSVEAVMLLVQAVRRAARVVLREREEPRQWAAALLYAASIDGLLSLGVVTCLVIVGAATGDGWKLMSATVLLASVLFNCFILWKRQWRLRHEVVQRVVAACEALAPHVQRVSGVVFACAWCGVVWCWRCAPPHCGALCFCGDGIVCL